jgi:putative hydrolase of the HAD superfamily
MKTYRHIFFDLDRTLWDLDQNSKEVIIDLCHKYQMQQRCATDFDHFYEVYQQINHDLWEDYRNGKVEKDFLSVERFHASFLHFGLDDRDLAASFGADYLKFSPFKNRLISGTHELLQYLSKKYKLHIITNGFDEVQTIKIRQSNLEPYFDQVIISEHTPWKKPSPEIFRYSLQQAGAKADESIMIGDDLRADIQGAAAVGMDQIWTSFDHSQVAYKPTYTVYNLLQIKEIL